jgi:hypothetical protein
MILFFLIAVFSFLLQLFLPWWSMTIAVFVISFLLGKKLWPVFFSSFFACGIIWLLMALYIHFTSGDIMTNRIAQLLSLNSSLMLYVGAFLTAGIIGGIAALAGFFLKEILKTKNEAIRI